MVLDGAGAGNDKQDREHHKHNYKSVHPQTLRGPSPSDPAQRFIWVSQSAPVLKAFTPEGLYKIVKRKTNFLTAKLQKRLVKFVNFGLADLNLSI